MAKSFAERIIAYRKKRKMTQLELANDLGIKQSTVCRWENGTTEPVGLYATMITKMMAEAKVRG